MGGAESSMLSGGVITPRPVNQVDFKVLGETRGKTLKSKGRRYH